MSQVNLRFPGQYFDMETALSYNYFRDYEASIGRYVQSDPIGYRAGPNTYAYALGDPNRSTDPFGLSTLTFDRSSGTLTFHPDLTPLAPQTYPASNRTRRPDRDPRQPEGNGPAPNGTYPVGPLIPTGQGVNDAFGPFFLPIELPLAIPYRVPRTGVGVHAGRANSPRGPGMAGTEGCIRG
jgi:RHS repeat-associated protein